MKTDLSHITTYAEVAAFFGLSYPQLTKLIYKTGEHYKYVTFKLPKKTGGYRIIKSPCRDLKAIQTTLKDALYAVCPARPSAHGFALDKSIVSNASMHLDKSYVFNVDLVDFFGTIHFGRVRNLFMARPLCFPKNIATILAHICCSENRLPQGAPTSPIVSNMIAWKLDGQLQRLAKSAHATYTRYADDITFSFTCGKKRLPDSIVRFSDDIPLPGETLRQIIEENGFHINDSKVRLSGKSSRMAVTGLTVNEFPNVRRKYVKQISSMLYAWKTHGYEAAEEEFRKKYDARHRASGVPKSFRHVVHGKLLFLRAVRGERDPIFKKLADQFNSLAGKDGPKVTIFHASPEESKVADALWVLEACYDDPGSGEPFVRNGTGFSLREVGLVTCAHVVANLDDGKLYSGVHAFKCTAVAESFAVKVLALDTHRDIAICALRSELGGTAPICSLEYSTSPVTLEQHVKVFGFPAYSKGKTHNVMAASVAALFPESGVRKFEIDKQIREGSSGGPVVDTLGRVAGVAVEGATKSSGNNAALDYNEIKRFADDPEYRV